MLPDYLARDLAIVFVGINPSTFSDRAGHYFARRSNMFWPVLFESGLVPEPLAPQDDRRLLEFGYGLTDVVKRPTPNVDTVSGEEFALGARRLKRKLIRYAPRVICFVGLHGYRKGFDRKALPGAQQANWGESRLYLVPSTSPRNAYYRPDIVEWFRRLKRYSVES